MKGCGKFGHKTSGIYRQLTMSWSETGPILVTKMSVVTSVTRSVEAGNW